MVMSNGKPPTPDAADAVPRDGAERDMETPVPTPAVSEPDDQPPALPLPERATLLSPEELVPPPPGSEPMPTEPAKTLPAKEDHASLAVKDPDFVPARLPHFG